MSKPSGQVYLCKNAIVDRNYGHTIDFKSPSEQLAYWGSLLKFSVDQELYTYIRRQRQELVVPYKLDDIQDVNYLYFRASEDSKYYFCFVDDKQYVSDTATRIYFTTDVLQTYMFDYTVKESYVVQEHCDRWDANHKPIYSRTEENLDYGSEYTIENAYAVMQDGDIDDQYRWYVAICLEHENVVTSGSSSTNKTRINNVATPYCMYLLPAKVLNLMGEEKYFNFHPDSTNTQTTVGGLGTFMQLMSKGVTVEKDGKEELVAIGNYVQQIIKLPYASILGLHVSGNTISNVPMLNGYSTTQLGTDNYIKINNVSLVPTVLAEMGIFEGIESATPTDEQWAKVKNDPYNVTRDRRFESKLLTYPYRYNLLTDWKGQPSIIKNEYIGSDKIKVKYSSGINFNNSVRYWVEGYKKDPFGRNNSVNQLVPEESPVINDAYYTYLLENKNQIQANQTNAMINGISSTVQGAVGGGLFGNLKGGVDPLGAVLGGVTAGVNAAINYQALIRSENAKQKDLKNYPDTVINSNDSSFNIIDGNEYICFYRYKICCEFEEQLADTFAMTGYTVKRVKVPNLKTRLRFNYVKTVGANIVGAFDQTDLATIRAIFDNGVTFWHYNKDHFKMYDYSLENIEVNLV